MSIIQTYRDIPTEPHKRKCIVVLDEVSFNKAMENYETGKFLLDEKIHYLVKPEQLPPLKENATENEKKGYELLDKLNKDRDNLLSKGSVLLNVNVFNDKEYLSYDNAIQNTAILQMTNFVTLCQCLGAKSVKYKILEDNREQNRTNVNASIDGSYKLFDAHLNTDYKQSIISEIKRQVTAKHEFSGSEPNLNKAHQIMKQGIFDDNLFIQAFFERACNMGNRKKSESIQFNLAENVCNQLNILANAGVNAPYLEKILNVSISGQFERVKELSKSIKVEYEVTF